MAPALPRSVMAAEDARFCDHFGFDLVAIRTAIEERGRGRFRGASTISQQVAKNVFLWQGRSWVRKGLEAGFTLLIEACGRSGGSSRSISTAPSSPRASSAPRRRRSTISAAARMR